MTDKLCIRLDQMSLKDRDTIPSDRFVATIIEHYSGNQPPKMVFAKATSDGFKLASGYKLNYDWNPIGWLDESQEIDFLPPAAAQTAVRPLPWQEDATHAIASDGMGGHYIFDKEKGRLNYESDQDLYLSANADNFKEVAKDHFEPRVLKRLD